MVRCGQQRVGMRIAQTEAKLFVAREGKSNTGEQGRKGGNGREGQTGPEKSELQYSSNLWGAASPHFDCKRD